MIKKKSETKKGLTAVIILLIPALWFLIKPGFYEPHDLHHFADIYEMYRAILSGQFPPRLGPDFLYSFGYPLFNYYYLLPFYIGALFHLVGFTLTASYKFVFIVSILLSGVGSFLFLKRHFSFKSSIFGSLVYVYAPYHAVQIYVRGAMGEALAFGIAPFIFYFTSLIIGGTKNKKLLGIGALVFGLFILSHNYYWILTLPFLTLYVVLNTIGRKSNAKLLIVPFLLGLIISAYWIGPALLEKKYILAETPFPLEDHFPFIKQLLLPSWGYGSSVWGPSDEISFQIGLVGLGAALVSMIWQVKDFIKRGSKNIISYLNFNPKTNILFWSVFSFVITIVFMNSRTYIIWKVLPFHNLIQFPWRLLAFLALFVSIMAAFVFNQFENKLNKLLTAIIVLLPILFTLTYFRPSHVVNKTDNDYLQRFFACSGNCSTNSEVSSDHKNYSEDYLLLPYWSYQRPNSVPQVRFESDSVEISNERNVSSIKWSVDIYSSKRSNMIANVIYFPGWFIEIDGQKVSTRTTGNIGKIEFDVPSGKHTISLYWAETKERKLFDLISVAGLLAVLYLLMSRDNISGEKVKG